MNVKVKPELNLSYVPPCSRLLGLIHHTLIHCNKRHLANILPLMRLELKPQKSTFGPEDTHRTVQVDQLVLNKGVSGATHWGWDKGACQPCPSLFPHFSSFSSSSSSSRQQKEDQRSATASERCEDRALCQIQGHRRVSNRHNIKTLNYCPQ